MHREAGFPLDYRATGYAYIERPNTALIDLLEAHVLGEHPSARVLDVGCGAGANARRIARIAPLARVVGVEPNPQAAALARQTCAEVFEGTLESFLEGPAPGNFDAVLLADVLEHIVDPLAFLARILAHRSLGRATLVISVPNYGVWYNRVRTLFGRFEYAWSGLYDRTHLRFFTRASLRKVLDYAGFELVADACSPSLVQSTAPLLRRFFEQDVASGNHLALGDSPAFNAYERFVEPVEKSVCRLWPELLGYQIVCVAKPR